MKDYDLEILCHPSKANVVANALSRKRTYGIAAMLTSQKPLLNELRKLEVELITKSVKVRLASLKLQPTLLNKFEEAQKQDAESKVLLELIKSGQKTQL